MSLETWLLFFAAYLMVTLSPGPNVLLVIKNAVKYGCKAATMTILSNLLCQLFIVVAVAFGAGALLEKSPVLFLGLKLLGGTYLIYLGLKGFLSKKKIDGGEAKVSLEVDSEGFSKRLSKDQHNPSVVFKEAFLVSASNPKTVIFLSAFLPQFLSTQEALTEQFTVMFFTICFIVTVVHLVYACVASHLSQRWVGLKAKLILSKITNCAFVAFGCGVLSSSRTT